MNMSSDRFGFLVALHRWLSIAIAVFVLLALIGGEGFIFVIAPFFGINLIGIPLLIFSAALGVGLCVWQIATRKPLGRLATLWLWACTLIALYISASWFLPQEVRWYLEAFFSY